jgi:hypothetical protein
MNSIQSARWFLLKAALTLTSVLLFTPQHLRAQQQQPATCASWTAVQSWSGTITVSGSGQSTDQAGNSSIVSESATINFKTARSPSDCNPFASNQAFNSETFPWLASASQVTYSVTVHDKVTRPCTGTDLKTYTATTSYDVDNGMSTTSSATVDMKFSNATSGGYGLSWDEHVDGMTITTISQGTCGNSSFTSNGEVWGLIPAATFLDYFLNPEPLPSTVSALTCNPALNFQAPSYLAGVATWTISCNIVPEFAYDVLVKTIPDTDYATWRPMGGTDETAIGNLLSFQASVVYKGTTQTAFGINPDQWNFTLKDFSSEPGVTLNWPPQNKVATPPQPDLDFNNPVNSLLYPAVNISPDGTTAQIPLHPTNVGNLSSVVMVVDSHDWGAWATLNITVTVAGQDISGHLTLPNGQNVTDILLPKRQPGSFIADSWKMNHGVPLATPDSDDSETSPDNNPYAGDGLTLYEEYRGIYVHCPTFDAASGSGCFGRLMHKEGDPKRKDLFVVNRAGPDVLAGMLQFASGSGVNVCCRTLGADQITSDHIINFNHAKGPHNTDQHAVIIVKGNANANPCTQTVFGGQGAAQPKNIQQIYMPTLGNFLNLARQVGTNATVPWAANSYPKAVAHELGHSVNVMHHGEGDTGTVVWSTGDGKSFFETPLSGGLPASVTVLAENGTQLRPSDLGISIGNPLKIWQGKPLTPNDLTGGQHSGDVRCFMRYLIAQQYVSMTDPNVRYYVAERESLGSYLTDIVQGTGTNDSNHPPQSRYGDASLGNCSKQMCVSDALNPPANPVGRVCSGQNGGPQ